MAKNKTDTAFYKAEKQSNECQCGRGKSPGYSFCPTCYKSLTNDMQRALYRRMGLGYEEAFEEASQWLSQR